MWRYIIRRILSVIPVVLAIVTIVFFLIRLAPGDPAEVMLGLYATDESVAQLRHELGLDRPLAEQYVGFLGGLIRGDLGVSFRTDLPVAQSLAHAFPATAELALASLAIALVIGIPAGIVAAVKRNSALDYASMFIAVFGVSMPVFWSGLLLMLVLSLYLGWLPASGRGTWQHLVMPALTLSAPTMAFVARLTRSEMLEVLNQDYIRVARSKGLHERIVILRHALSNALLPTVTAIGVRFGALLGGAVLTETIFAWPGLGRLMITSINARDFAMIQGSVILLAVIFVSVNLLVDITYAIVDPRIRY